VIPTQHWSKPTLNNARQFFYKNELMGLPFHENKQNFQHFVSFGEKLENAFFFHKKN
jgi:hypothetical protein